MSSATDFKDELNNIQRKLDSIEKKVGKKWVVPVVVALITAVFGLVTVIVQIKIQSSTKVEIMRRVAEEQVLGTISGTEIAHFYGKTIDLIEKISTGFERVCYFTPTNTPKAGVEDHLTRSLEQYRVMLENSPVGIDEETKNKLGAYSEFVAESQFNIRFNKIASDKIMPLLTKSRALRSQAAEALKTSRRRGSFR